MKDVVILAGTTPYSVLSLSKIACKQGSRVFCLCVDFLGGKNYSYSKYIYKSYDVDGNSLKEFFVTFLTKYSFKEKPILYATTDNTCIWMDNNRDFISKYFDLCLPSSYIVKSFNNKDIASLEAQKNGLLVPKTINVKNEADSEKVITNFHFPVIIKPLNAKAHKKLGFKMIVINESVEFERYSKEILANNESFLCQEYIPGGDTDCKFYIFYRDASGNITECMGEKTLQSNGIMTIGTTKYDDKLASISRNFITNIDYVGIGGIEYKKFKDSYFFIEMSTRTEGFVAISDMAGVSLAESSYNNFNNKQYSRIQQKENIKYVVCLSWVVSRISSGKIFTLFQEFLKFVLKRDCKFVDFYIDAKYIMKDYLKKIRKKIFK